MAFTPTTIHGDDSPVRMALTVIPQTELCVALHRRNWMSRMWGIGVSAVVHAIAFGLAALIIIQPRPSDVAAYLDSKWSKIETPVVKLDAILESPVPPDESDSTREAGGSSFADLLDLAQLAETDEVSLTREVTLSTTVKDVTSLRASPRTKQRAAGAVKQGLATATVGQRAGEGNGIGDGKGFFGTMPEAKSVVFVVDNSRSMNHKHDSPAKTRYRRVKFELVKSILEMPAESQFFVIFFCDVTLPMPATDLQPATPEMKDRYVRWMVQVDTGGGPTDPRGAMQAALRMQPDIIYFLTDGEFERGVNLKLMSIQQPRTMIHTFAFGERLGEDVLKAIARKNRGEYKFIP